MNTEVVNRLNWSINGRALEKKDLAIIDLISTNNWERPIYFNTTSLSQVKFNIRPYAVLEGLTYRLMPIQGSNGNEVNTEVMYDNLMNKFHWKGLQDSTVYFSEDYRNFALNHRASFSALSDALVSRGEFDKAKDIMTKCLEAIPDASIKFDNFNVAQINNMLSVGMEEEARYLAEVTATRAEEMLAYLKENNINKPREKQINLLLLNELTGAFKNSGDNEQAQKYDALFRKYYQ